MRLPRKKYTKKRLVLSGSHLEIYNFQNPIAHDSSAQNKTTSSPEENLEKKQENRERAKGRSRKMIRRLTYANFGLWKDSRDKPYISKFLTLTFRENVQDVKEANKLFTLFIKRLNYKLFQEKTAKVQYLAVIEIQPTSKKIHYHIILFNLPFIKRYIDLFNETWRQGYIWIEKITNGQHAARYITKYMTKEDDERLEGEKSYFCSRGLKRPVAVLSEVIITEIENALRDKKPEYQNTFQTEYTGLTTYACYEIADPSITQLIMAYKRPL